MEFVKASEGSFDIKCTAKRTFEYEKKKNDEFEILKETKEVNQVPQSTGKFTQTEIAAESSMSLLSPPKAPEISEKEPKKFAIISPSKSEPINIITEEKPKKSEEKTVKVPNEIKTENIVEIKGSYNDKSKTELSEKKEEEFEIIGIKDNDNEEIKEIEIVPEIKVDTVVEHFSDGKKPCLFMSEEANFDIVFTPKKREFESRKCGDFQILTDVVESVKPENEIEKIKELDIIGQKPQIILDIEQPNNVSIEAVLPKKTRKNDIKSNEINYEIRIENKADVEDRNVSETNKNEEKKTESGEDITNGNKDIDGDNNAKDNSNNINLPSEINSTKTMNYDSRTSTKNITLSIEPSSSYVVKTVVNKEKVDENNTNTEENKHLDSPLKLEQNIISEKEGKESPNKEAKIDAEASETSNVPNDSVGESNKDTIIVNEENPLVERIENEETKENVGIKNTVEAVNSVINNDDKEEVTLEKYDTTLNDGKVGEVNINDTPKNNLNNNNTENINETLETNTETKHNSEIKNIGDKAKNNEPETNKRTTEAEIKSEVIEEGTITKNDENVDNFNKEEIIEEKRQQEINKDNTEGEDNGDVSIIKDTKEKKENPEVISDIIEEKKENIMNEIEEINNDINNSNKQNLTENNAKDNKLDSTNIEQSEGKTIIKEVVLTEEIKDNDIPEKLEKSNDISIEKVIIKDDNIDGDKYKTTISPEEIKTTQNNCDNDIHLKSSIKTTPENNGQKLEKDNNSKSKDYKDINYYLYDQVIDLGEKQENEQKDKEAEQKEPDETLKKVAISILDKQRGPIKIENPKIIRCSRVETEGNLNEMKEQKIEDFMYETGKKYVDEIFEDVLKNSNNKVINDDNRDKEREVKIDDFNNETGKVYVDEIFDSVLKSSDEVINEINEEREVKICDFNNETGKDYVDEIFNNVLKSRNNNIEINEVNDAKEAYNNTEINGEKEPIIYDFNNEIGKNYVDEIFNNVLKSNENNVEVNDVNVINDKNKDGEIEVKIYDFNNEIGKNYVDEIFNNVLEGNENDVEDDKRTYESDNDKFQLKSQTSNLNTTTTKTTTATVLVSNENKPVTQPEINNVKKLTANTIINNNNNFNENNIIKEEEEELPLLEELIVFNSQEEKRGSNTKIILKETKEVKEEKNENCIVTTVNTDTITAITDNFSGKDKLIEVNEKLVDSEIVQNKGKTLTKAATDGNLKKTNERLNKALNRAKKAASASKTEHQTPKISSKITEMANILQQNFEKVNKKSDKIDGKNEGKTDKFIDIFTEIKVINKMKKKPKKINFTCDEGN